MSQQQYEIPQRVGMVWTRDGMTRKVVKVGAFGITYKLTRRDGSVQTLTAWRAAFSSWAALAALAEGEKKEP